MTDENYRAKKCRGVGRQTVAVTALLALILTISVIAGVDGDASFAHHVKGQLVVAAVLGFAAGALTTAVLVMLALDDAAG